MLGHARHRRTTGQYDPAVATSTYVVLAAVAIMVLAGLTVYRKQGNRTPHLQALVAGDVTVEELPEALQKRLTSPRHRSALAGTLRKTAKDARKVAKRKTLPNPPVTYHFEEHVRDQISGVADLMEQPETSPRAVALTELLLADGTSPFYGESEADLLDVLGQIREAA
jgi:hypothetical protein